MKKIISIILGGFMILMLAACGQTAEPVKTEAESKNAVSAGKEQANKEKESKLTLEEVFKKTEEANKDINSFASQMNMKQNIEVSGEKQEFQSDIEMEFILEPMALHQKMTMSLAGEKQEVDAYLTKEGFYMYEPNEKMWFKLPEEFSTQILQMSEGQTNPSGQLEQLKEFVDEFEFQQDDKNFILTLKASGEKFDQFLKDNVKNVLPAEMQADNMMGDMKFNEVKYELHIDKETFYLNTLNMVLDTDTQIEDEKMNMKIDMQSTYSNYNKVENIEIPKEALENAQEIN
ncbi:DUF6612 family protein [Lederbergia wuyishanensis]|uniref:Lipoprotein n=1 Tax=Lederbergia wuyishanensis TaxID=1347903 RepID=A0ABU0D6Z5_9BACI|nr:DUF6612 family protein [Lederbergia wuyishanensis]MCJ8008861.1 hypothetical protein [Lederbergia wuyishanensis]MDQ0344183.1 hypothetical protein [Lederbergia wuyishanensis]